MDDLLKAFLAILKEMEPFEIDHSEDPIIFTARYSTQLSVIKEIAEKYQAVFSDFKVSFELLYERKLDFHAFRQNVRFITTEEPLELKLTVNKKHHLNLAENTFVFFKLDSFYKHFDALNQKLFEQLNLDKNITIHLPTDKLYSNSYVQLIPLSKESIKQAAELSHGPREELTRVRKIHDEITRGGSHHPLPDYYAIDELSAEFTPWFERNLFTASLLYLANKLEGKNVIIRGHKNAEVTLPEELKLQNAISIFNIYRFCYEEKHYNDKIEIARNIFTIYLNSTDNSEKLDELLPKIEKTISSHFSAYIQDSIKKFFNDRKDVIKEAHKFATDLKAESDKLLTYINTSLIGVITAIFAGALGLSKGERWYLIAAFALHALLFIFSFEFNRNYVENRKKEITSLYDKYTSKFVILAEDDLDDIKKIYIEPAEQNVNTYLNLYKKVILWLVAFMVVLIVVGSWLPSSFFTTSDQKGNSVPAVTNNVYNNKP